MAERKPKLSDFSDAHRRDWSGMFHREIVAQQSKELRGMMKNPSFVPDYDGRGPVSVQPAVNVERYQPMLKARVEASAPTSVRRIGKVDSRGFLPPPEEECFEISQPRVFYEEHLTDEEPVIVAEWKFKEFVWTTRLLRKLPPHYFDLLFSLRIPPEDFQMRIEGYHCYKHVPDDRRRCSVERIYLPLVTAGKYHPYQSFKHRCRASSQALERLEFLGEECRKRRVKFDYVIKVDLTLPKQVSELWDSEKTQFCINKAVKEFLRLLHDELFPKHHSQFGVIMNHHFWATRTPLEPHRHIHLTIPNVIFNPKTGMFHRIRPWVDEKKIKECWWRALKRQGLWVDVPDHVRPDTYVGYIKFEERGKVIHRLSYCSRKPIEDLATNLTQEQLFDFDKDFAWFLIGYTPRRINLGFLCNLKRFGYSRKRAPLRCPVCGGEMVLELDDEGQPINCDRPPPSVTVLIKERRREWLRLPRWG